MSETTFSRMADAGAITLATELVAAAEQANAEARILGGVAVAMRCPSAGPAGPLARTYSDIDVVTTKRSAARLTEALQGTGFQPDSQFNAVHGHTRLMFDHTTGMHVDVFIDEFIMCHRLDLRPRLAVDDATLSLADLVLTKLQVAELNAKDVTDAAALLWDHELRPDDAGINIKYISEVLGKDWGWWRTVSENLGRLPSHCQERLPRAGVDQVTTQVAELVRVIDAAPKGIKWKARARIGDRMPWRDEPEESH